MKNLNKLTRVVQVVWLIIAVVCIVEAGLLFTQPEGDKNSAYLFIIVALFAIFRFILLRRKQLRDENRM